MVQDSGYAGRFTELLAEGIASIDLYGLSEDEDGNEPEVNVTETYEEAGVLTSDKGLMLSMSDGARVRITITAYVPQDHT